MKSSAVRLTLASAVAAALMLTSCGGDDSESSPSTTAPNEATTPDSESAGGDGADCPPADGSATPTQQFDGAPPMCIDPTKSYTATIETNMGTVEAKLFAEKAPNTVNNFVVLSRYHYYDNTECHRIISNFMAQCGDPTGTGSGGPGYMFQDELPAAGEYQIGSLAMANAGPNTQGSQFFIITGTNGTQLPPAYSLFGEVDGGLTEVLSQIDAAGNNDPSANGMPPLQPVTIESITISES